MVFRTAWEISGGRENIMTNLEKITAGPGALVEFLITYEANPAMVCQKEVWNPEREPYCEKSGADCRECLHQYLAAEATV